MILFGYKTKSEVIARLIGKCEKCKRITPHSLVKTVYWFNLYFIPIFPFSTKKQTYCHACGHMKDFNGDETKLRDVSELLKKQSKKQLKGGKN